MKKQILFGLLILSSFSASIKSTYPDYPAPDEKTDNEDVETGYNKHHGYFEIYE